MAKVKKNVDLQKLEWLTLQQAGEILQISAKTIQRRCEDRTILATRIGIKWRIPRASLDRLAKQG